MKATIGSGSSRIGWALIFSFLLWIPQTPGGAAIGQRGMVATGHPLATEAGLQALRRGGNAIDAAVAAGLTLGVVDGHNSGIGGGCFILIRLANGRFHGIDGRETAPLAATRDMYVRNGRLEPSLSQTGPLAIAVPGALAAYHHVATNFGRLKFSEPLEYAANIAARGFAIDATYAQRLQATVTELASFAEAKSIFLHPDGPAKRAGELLLQPDLAKTYRSIASHGTLWFYNGPFSLKAGDWIVSNGGLLTTTDIAIYPLMFRQPIVSTYRGYTIHGFPPPSSGGLHVAQVLNILENFDLKRMGTNSADTIHVIAEAMKLAFADRAFWPGDPDYVKVPRGLADKAYGATLARQIRRDRVTAVPRHGIPPRAQQDVFRHTTHFSTVDAAGNWVACTATINTSFGSKVVIPGTGVLMNNEMDDFAAQPGATNFFGLIGSEANSIAPRKRPLSSMSPTIVSRQGRPIAALGAAGGPTIISQTLLAIVNMADFGMDLEAALAQPRIHHQWYPDELRVERGVEQTVLEELRRRGHNVVVYDTIGAAQAVGVAERGFIGVADPRGLGRAQGW
jgi:gamma-glutamyltranspeptidase/glutathione hydrolase